jgi:hypothetical protein
MPNQVIHLDPEIRDWVLLPIVFILLLVGLIRHYVTLLMRSKTTASAQSTYEKQVIAYCRVLLGNGAFLPKAEFKARVDRMIQPETGVLRQEAEAPNPMDPSMMGDMMKNNVVHMVPNMLMMHLISTFFSGFVMAKFPFPLADKFKGMVQRGVDIDYLDGAYATSMSLYFIIMFGLNGVVRLVLGDAEGADSGSSMAMADPSMAMLQQQQKGPVDMPKIFKGTAEELQFALDTYQPRLQHACDLFMQGK